MSEPGALSRSGQCPSCGAPVEFPFAAALAQVCRHCRFVVVRTDRGFQVNGRVAELLPIRSSLGIGGTGTLDGKRFRVAGRVQYERVTGSAPWQEFFLELGSGEWVWVAEAQGRTYVTALVPSAGLPPHAAAVVGFALGAPGGPALVLAERGERRLVAAGGELPFPIRPGQIEHYADLSGPDGAFGTLDYGDGAGQPLLFVGRQIDPAILRVDPGSPGSEAPAVSTTALHCPSCGGDLPLLVPEQAQRIVCRYCGMQSDLSQGALVALKPTTLPVDPPVLPIGARGRLRDADVTCVGMLGRTTRVEDEEFSWREYLLHAGDTGYVWLVHDEGAWQYVVPIAAGDVLAGGEQVLFRGERFTQAQWIQAWVSSVVGEFYWKVEVSESVAITEYRGPRGARISCEAGHDEVTWSLAAPISASELRAAFADVPFVDRSGRRRSWYLSWAALFVAWLAVTLVSCATSPGETLLRAQVPVPAELATPADPLAPDGAFFSEPFAVPHGEHRVDLTVRVPSLDNSWATASCALVNEDTGDVFEANVDLEYYSGVEGGESWSEGSRSSTVSFAGVKGGRYLARVEPALEPGKWVSEMTVEVVRAPFRWAPVLLSFAGLLGLLFVGRATATGGAS